MIIINKLYKISILLIIVIITSISIFTIYNKTVTNSYKFLSIGDGLSKGLNHYSVNGSNYNEFIKKYLESKNKRVSYYNYSFQDISISELTNDIIYLKNKTLKDYLHNSNLIVLSIGEVEIKEDKNNAEIEEDLKNLISEIKRYNSNICLLGHYYLNNGNNKKIKDMNNIYKKIAKDNNIIFINLDGIDYYYSRNNIYPSTVGHREISNLIIKAINLKDKQN